jgi:arsenite-transporting ATPase
MEHYFAPVPVRQVPMFRDEIVGYDRLRKLAAALYLPGENPAAINRMSAPFSFAREGEHYVITLDLPFAEKGEIGVFKKNDELVIEVGTIRRHVGLPTSMAGLPPLRASLEGRKLRVELGEKI